MYTYTVCIAYIIYCIVRFFISVLAMPPQICVLFMSASAILNECNSSHTLRPPFNLLARAISLTPFISHRVVPLALRLNAPAPRAMPPIGTVVKHYVQRIQIAGSTLTTIQNLNTVSASRPRLSSLISSL